MKAEQLIISPSDVSVQKDGNNTVVNGYSYHSAIGIIGGATLLEVVRAAHYKPKSAIVAVDPLMGICAGPLLEQMGSGKDVDLNVLKYDPTLTYNYSQVANASTDQLDIASEQFRKYPRGVPGRNNNITLIDGKYQDVDIGKEVFDHVFIGYPVPRMLLDQQLYTFLNRTLKPGGTASFVTEFPQSYTLLSASQFSHVEEHGRVRSRKEAISVYDALRMDEGYFYVLLRKSSEKGLNEPHSFMLWIEAMFPPSQFVDIVKIVLLMNKRNDLNEQPNGFPFT